jgi:hypothetical protein
MAAVIGADFLSEGVLRPRFAAHVLVSSSEEIFLTLVTRQPCS